MSEPRRATRQRLPSAAMPVPRTVAPTGDAGNPEATRTPAFSADAVAKFKRWAAGRDILPAEADTMPVEDLVETVMTTAVEGEAPLQTASTAYTTEAGLAAECATCQGKGTIRDGHMDCPDCGGTGQMSQETPMLWSISQNDDGTWTLRHGDEPVGEPHTSADLAVAAIPSDDLGIVTAETGGEFQMICCAEGVDTGNGDNRYLEVGGGTWRTPPRPLMLMTVNDDGHKGAVLAGRIDDFQRLGDGRRIWARGVYDTSDAGVEARRLVEEHMAGHVSVDIGPCEVTLQALEIDATDGWPTRVLQRFGPYEIMGATIVPFEALTEAVIWNAGMGVPDEVTAPLPDPISIDAEPVLVNQPTVEAGDVNILEEIALLAAATGAAGLPLAARDYAWDAAGAEGRVRTWAGAADGPNAKYGRAFFWRDSAGGDKFGDYKLGFADVLDGTLTAIPRGVFAVAQRLDGTQIPAPDKTAIRSKVGAYYSAMAKKFDDPSIKVPWTAESTALTHPGAIIASAVAIPSRPPRTWFEDPTFDAPQRVTVTDDGRIFGHIAEWNCCHTGYADRCISPPRDPNNCAYEVFLTGEVTCDDDSRVMTGRVTVGGTHASERFDAREAARHYDDASTCAADVNVGEDAFGIWIAGALRPSVTEEQLRILRGSAPSGDWRPVDNKNQLMIVHAVNSPGFPVRARVDEHGEVLGLVAGAGLHLATNRFAPHPFSEGGPDGTCRVCQRAHAPEVEEHGTIEDLEAELHAAVDRHGIEGRLDVIERAIEPLLAMARERLVDGLLPADPQEPSPLERYLSSRGGTQWMFTGSAGANLSSAHTNGELTTIE